MAELSSDDRLDRPDDLYAALTDVHEGLSEEESTALDARVILLLANHIGAASVTIEALRQARESVLAHREDG